jgi:menaquinone-dependent protoporphyrinogen IX oxidase
MKTQLPEPCVTRRTAAAQAGAYMKLLAFLLSMFVVSCCYAEDCEMKDILIVIAGLTPERDSDSADVDGVSGASRTVHGALRAHTTSEIGREMGRMLEENGAAVDLIAADAGGVNLSRYELVIIGSGIYGGRPHGSIKSFIAAHEPALRRVNVALFAVCGSLCTDSEKGRSKARTLVDKMTCGLVPVSKAVFCGTVKDFGALGNWLGKTFFKTYPAGDYRDWKEILRWTIALPQIATAGER